MASHSNVKSRRKLITPVFHLQTKEEDDSQLSKGMIKNVRRTGQLNLSGRSLAHVPERMFTMYDLTPEDTSTFIDFGKQPEEENWWQFKSLTYLDLSSNVLQEIPEKIGIFEDLSILNLQDNNITCLPPEIGKLTKLTKLNLSHNKISMLPNEFYKLIELQVLSLAHNNLGKLSKNFGDLVMLQQLDLSYNLLTKLPPGMGFLVRLTEINFSNNKLIELPPDIVNLRGINNIVKVKIISFVEGLLKLDVTHNDLVYLPKMGELKKLQYLYAQHNNIEEIPDFEDCTHLQEIYFGNNYIQEITPDFCENMPNLKILDLRDNKIESLPNQIAMLQHLIRLDITNNDLSDLPNSLSLLAHLQNLQLEGNKLKKMRSDILKGGTIRILKHLKEKFDGEELENLPKPTNVTSFEAKTFPDKYGMKHSHALNVTLKQLTIVPDHVFEDAKAAEVTVVDLCKNKLDKVPDGLKLIAEDLTELNLSMNVLTKIPDFLNSSSKLTYLDLGNNCLTQLPDLSSLHSLRELILSNNRFTEIPQCVYSMANLEILLATDNKITKIDVDGLKKLKRIAVLDLGNNNIAQVPPELGTLTQLRSLELKGNCFRQPRYAILEQGTDSILSYLRDRIPK